MSFELLWRAVASRQYEELRTAALATVDPTPKKGKTSKQMGLFNQVLKCVELLANNPRHPGLQTHEFHGILNPYDPKQKVFEAYAQNRTPGAYRVFWCYGPGKDQITILAITPHP
jgi:hypothetical protein